MLIIFLNIRVKNYFHLFLNNNFKKYAIKSTKWKILDI